MHLRHFKMEQLSFNFKFKHHTFRKYNAKHILLNVLKNKAIEPLRAKLFKLSAATFKKLQFLLPFTSPTRSFFPSIN